MQVSRHVVYDIRDEVMLSAINLKLPIGSSRVKKFTSRFIGPFTMTDMVANGLAYTQATPSHGLASDISCWFTEAIHYSIVTRRPLNPISSRTATNNGKWKLSLITAPRAAGENHPTSLSGLGSPVARTLGFQLAS
jgi:hypothetical protein